MTTSVIKINSNCVTIEGSAEFVAKMQETVIQALQSTPIASAPAKRGRKASAAKSTAKAAPKKRAARKGKRRGRLPGRTVNGKYIKPGDPIPAGYQEIRGRIVAAAGAKAKAKVAKPRRKKAGRKKATAKR